MTWEDVLEDGDDRGRSHRGCRWLRRNVLEEGGDRGRRTRAVGHTGRSIRRLR